MARPITLTERFLARLPPGTLDRIRAVAKDGSVAAFIRCAIAGELEHRERKNTVQKPSRPSDSAGKR